MEEAKMEEAKIDEVKVEDMEVTRSVIPKEPSRRHRRAMPNQGRVAEVWALQDQPLAYCNTLRADDGAIYASGHCIARWVEVIATGRVFILWTNEQWSSGGVRHTPLRAISRLKREGRIGELVIHRVGNPLADSSKEHRLNLFHLEDDAMQMAIRAKRAFKSNRLRYAEYAIKTLRGAFDYGRDVGFCDLPDRNMPLAILADWLRENRPSFTALAECAACLCPMTGGELSSAGSRPRKSKPQSEAPSQS